MAVTGNWCSHPLKEKNAHCKNMHLIHIFKLHFIRSRDNNLKRNGKVKGLLKMSHFHDDNLIMCLALPYFTTSALGSAKVKQ